MSAALETAAAKRAHAASVLAQARSEYSAGRIGGGAFVAALLLSKAADADLRKLESSELGRAATLAGGRWDD